MEILTLRQIIAVVPYVAVSWFVLYAYNSANVMFEINEVRNKIV